MKWKIVSNFVAFLEKLNFISLDKTIDINLIMNPSKSSLDERFSAIVL